MKKNFWAIAGGILILGLPVLLLFFFLQDRGDADGHIEVKIEQDRPGGGKFTRLMLDGVDYGRNYLKPDPKDPGPDRSRLATTYYHQKSPVGVVLQQFDWFGEYSTPNRYGSDARLPASLLGLSAPGPFFPAPILSGLWSEPAMGVVGLGCGTPASYARPYQHLHFYERGPALIKLSFPPAGETAKFHFVEDALKRGAIVQVFAGDERETLAKQGPEGFYHVLIVETARAHPDRPVVKRLTREAMSLYMHKLAPAGIICYHTSSRNYDLAPLLGDIAKDLGLVSLAGKIQPKQEDGDRPLYSSDWLLVARRNEDLAGIQAKGGPDLTWSNPRISGQLVMTDAKTSVIRDARRR